MAHRFGTVRLLLIVGLVISGNIESVGRPLPMRAATEFRIEASVLRLERVDLIAQGILPRGGTAPSTPLGFATNLPEGVARSLAEGLRTKTVQKLQFTAASGKGTQIRIGSRLAATDGELEYLYAGIDMEVTPSVSPSGDISILIVSQVQVRRGGQTALGREQIVFASQSIRNEIGFAEGNRVIVGGFVNDAEIRSLKNMPGLKDSPVLDYVLSETAKKDDVELVVLLTPHIIRGPATISLDRPVAPAAASARPASVAASPAPPTPSGANAPVVQQAPAALALYTVQVGAFKSLDTARELHERLGKRYDDVFIETVSNEQTLYRVRVGRLEDLVTARKLEMQLRREGFRPVVASLN
jgi:hypothetical protein